MDCPAAQFQAIRDATKPEGLPGYFFYRNSLSCKQTFSAHTEFKPSYPSFLLSASAQISPTWVDLGYNKTQSSSTPRFNCNCREKERIFGFTVDELFVHMTNSKRTPMKIRTCRTSRNLVQKVCNMSSFGPSIQRIVAYPSWSVDNVSAGYLVS